MRRMFWGVVGGLEMKKGEVKMRKGGEKMVRGGKKIRRRKRGGFWLI